MSTFAGAIDITTQKPAIHHYAVALKFYDKDLQRRYRYTHDNAYELQGKTEGRGFYIQFVGPELYIEKGRVAGILDTDDPEIKTVVLMFGFSSDPISDWIFEQKCCAITPSSQMRDNEEMTPESHTYGDSVWGRSIDYSHVFEITEADWDYCFGN